MRPLHTPMIDASNGSPGLEQLYRLTIDILGDEDHMTRALDWVDTVLPVFAAACRFEVSKPTPSNAIDLWIEWLGSDEVYVVEEAGKGEMFDWRVRWLRILLDVARRLQTTEDCHRPETRSEIAEEVWKGTPNKLACFQRTFWVHLIDYLCGSVDPGPAAN